MGEYVVAVDVGTGSARAGVVDKAGRFLAKSAHPISMLRENGLSAAHSSADIWHSVVRAVRDAVAAAAIDPLRVDAIGFDATCSLVFLDGSLSGLSISRDGSSQWDTIAWLDHRSIAEADELTRIGGKIIVRSGGTISPEMQLPKLLWVKRHLPEVWSRTGAIFDLADFLTFKATGNLARSYSTLSTKWGFDIDEPEGWDPEFLARADLGDLSQRAGIAGIPGKVGTVVGNLSDEAASQLGLPASVLVAPGMVDAYAGAIALLGSADKDENVAALVGGTSTCLMAFQQSPESIDAFWGPFDGAAIPGRFIIEGGQSAAGALLDQVASFYLKGEVTSADHDRILHRIGEILKQDGSSFNSAMHILPDFHGNRSPFADAGMKGVISGLTLDRGFDALCGTYYRAMVSLALGLRQVLEAMETVQGRFDSLHLGGGHARNPLLTELYANATGRRIVIGAGEEAMLLGTSMNAATAAGWFRSLEEACVALERPFHVIEPDKTTRLQLERDYLIFRKMQLHRAELQSFEDKLSL